MSSRRSSWLGAMVLLAGLPWGCGDDTQSVAANMALLPVADQSVVVGAELQVQLTVTNSAGIAPEFRASSPTLPDFNSRTSRPTFLPFGAGGIMRWTPLVTDVGQHTIEVEAFTTAGVAWSAFNVTVQPGQAAPVFRQPLGSGTTLDLAGSNCVTVDVLVEDFDTPMVRISLEPPVEENYVFTADGPLAGTFEFCPSQQQIEKSELYTVNFAAEDEDGHITRKKYTVVLRRSVGENCGGQAPTISHVAPRDQSTRGQITFTAEIADDQGLGGQPKLYYSLDTQSWARGIDVSQFTAHNMVRVDGGPQSGTYQASLPSPVADAEPGQTGSLFYFIEATDDDDAMGNCDHRVAFPEDEVLTVEVVAPERGLGLGVCGACQTDADCQSGLCVQVGGTNHCVQGCASAVPEACGSLTEAGCCEGNILRYCDGGRVSQLNCAERPACGWNPRRATYYCQTNGSADPSGAVPIQCPFADCPTGTTCADGAATTVDGTQAFVCVPDAGRCEVPDDPDPEVDPGGVPACVDDIFEDNDTQAADLIEFGPGDYTNLRLCGDGTRADSDYYPITVERSTQLSVALFFTHDDGDIDMSLKGEDGSTLASGVTITDDEEITRCMAEGLYYINVWSINGRINASYDMSIDLGTCCLDDPRETPGDDRVDDATPVDGGVELRDGQICEMDEDWFSLALGAGDALSVFLKFDHDGPQDDLDLYLYDADLQIVGEGASLTSHENLAFTAETAGVYTLRVLGHMGAANDYQIRFDVTRAGGDSPDVPDVPDSP